jgi:hypothetical protein
MPTSPKDVLAASLSAVLIACVLVLLWYKTMRPGFKARRRAADLGRKLGLLPVSSGALGQEFCLGQMSWALGVACVAGQRRGMRAGIFIQPMRSRRACPYTGTVIAGPHARGIAVSLQRGQPLFGETPTTFSGIMASAFTAYGPALEISRVFHPNIQARLHSFPRQLLGAHCNESSTWIMWEGIEADSTVCDQALEIAAEIAKFRSS